MVKAIKRFISKLIGKDIFIGKSVTCDDKPATPHAKETPLYHAEHTVSDNNRRVSGITCKYALKASYCIYELIGVNFCRGNNTINYRLINTKTDEVITVSEQLFEKMFDKHEVDHVLKK